ncbi:hypothetical protein EC973_008160 [Apophysomyces ossiformis]|uniref:Uncharacterized protein n=1 Tax=Apophysomyces ossiformis TaxID=679940 RepID=A0A8H7EQG1_9FUNG|nr:hypothetical protein EC973_008160 [Apophysomyces ossiformis]
MPVFSSEGSPAIMQLDNTIKQYKEDYNDMIMQFAAFVEVVGVMGRLTAGVLLFRTSVLALIVFGHFLRLRYYLSPYTRSAVHSATEHLDHWLLPPTADPRVPPFLSKLYVNVKDIMVHYGSANVAVQSNSSSE